MNTIICKVGDTGTVTLPGKVLCGTDAAVQPICAKLSHRWCCLRGTAGDCCRTLLPAYPEALVVQDAQKDARFKDNPLVSWAYQGV